MHSTRFPGRTLLASAVVMALAATPQADATVIVTDLICTLDKAITTANTDQFVDGCPVKGSGTDTIEILSGNTILTAETPPITSDINFVGLSVFGKRTITGDGVHRLFFIGDETHAPLVTFTNMIFTGGVAQGGSSVAGSNAGGGGGAGAGLGGALFIYDGLVAIDNSSFITNSATGGKAQDSITFGAGGSTDGSGSAGGGGMSGNAGAGGDNLAAGGNGTSGGFGGGGGGGGDVSSFAGGGTNGGGGGGAFGGNGGVSSGNTAPGAGAFGSAGGGGAGAASSGVASQSGAAGGFGGGGGGGGGAGAPLAGIVPGAGGAGGFGGGGGAGGSTGNDTFFPGGAGGSGGFGAGGGAGGIGFGIGALGGHGYGGSSPSEGGGGGAAGFGGAIFIRSGHLDLAVTDFQGNTGVAGISFNLEALGKGGALFALHILTNPGGSDQGMPASLPTVTGCQTTFAGNGASNAGASDTDNADTFGLSRTSLAGECSLIFKNGFEP